MKLDDGSPNNPNSDYTHRAFSLARSNDDGLLRAMGARRTCRRPAHGLHGPCCWLIGVIRDSSPHRTRRQSAKVSRVC
jgi:hypothetical protein